MFFCTLEKSAQRHIFSHLLQLQVFIHPNSVLLQFRTDIARTEYLSNADERLRWQANSLPADDLCTENAIMLKRFNRSVYLSSAIFKIEILSVLFLGVAQSYYCSVQVPANY